MAAEDVWSLHTIYTTINLSNKYIVGLSLFSKYLVEPFLRPLRSKATQVEFWDVGLEKKSLDKKPSRKLGIGRQPSVGQTVTKIRIICCYSLSSKVGGCTTKRVTRNDSYFLNGLTKRGLTVLR